MSLVSDVKLIRTDPTVIVAKRRRKVYLSVAIFPFFYLGLAQTAPDSKLLNGTAARKN